jgi:hypothetical protein
MRRRSEYFIARCAWCDLAHLLPRPLPEASIRTLLTKTTLCSKGGLDQQTHRVPELKSSATPKKAGLRSTSPLIVVYMRSWRQFSPKAWRVSLGAMFLRWLSLALGLIYRFFILCVLRGAELNPKVVQEADLLFMRPEVAVGFFLRRRCHSRFRNSRSSIGVSLGGDDRAGDLFRASTGANSRNASDEKRASRFAERWLPFWNKLDRALARLGWLARITRDYLFTSVILVKSRLGEESSCSVC